MNNKLIEKMIAYDRGDPKRIQHFLKVYEFAKIIGEQEGLAEETQQILETAAIVHDIGIHYCEEHFGACHGKLQEQYGPDIARQMLTELSYNEQLIDRVCYLVSRHHTYQNIDGMDYQILVEADFLVNMYEDGLEQTAVQSAYEKIFQTKTGKQICKIMYNL